MEWGPPSTLVEGIDGDPVVAIAAPRPDLEGALYEFLIGLLTTALSPPDEREWRARWKEPPGPDDIAVALEELPSAFDLDGDGPRFLQDFAPSDLADLEMGSIDQLFIDAPGDQALRLNKDLFVKRGRVEKLGRPAGAMALLTLQTYSPSGGKGHRTSLRGGGPLTTLVDPRSVRLSSADPAVQPLWQMLWANVETKQQLENRRPSGAPDSWEDVYPWLDRTRTSEPKTGISTTAKDADPLQAYFGMPRRIRLEFGAGGDCDITGLPDERLVTGFRMRNYGTQYLSWMHPLSPHRRNKPTDEWLPVHGQPGGVGWRDWLGLTLRNSSSGVRRAAQSVAAFADRANSLGMHAYRLRTFGYDVDKMKARAWVDATLPLFATVDGTRNDSLTAMVGALTDGTELAARELQSLVRAALFDRADAESAELGDLRLELWHMTEQRFYDAVAKVADPAIDSETALLTSGEQRHAFAEYLLMRATEIFDRWCPAEGLTPAAIQRRVFARHALVRTLRGRSKSGATLQQTLGIAAEQPPETRQRKSRGRKEAAT